MSSMTTLERSLSCTSSTSLSMSSPRLSVRRETTPPRNELSLTHLHDRMNQLDSRVLELRSNVLTKDGYVDRRNREDEHIRREFENHRIISHRIDLNVVALRSDVDQIKTSIFQLKSSIGQSGTETVFLRGDVDRLQKSVEQLQIDAEQMKSDVCASRIDISKLQSTANQLRTDLLTLEHKLTRQMHAMETSLHMRMDSMESRMRHSERVRFNSLAHTIHAPINPVPVILDDGSPRMAQVLPAYRVEVLVPEETQSRYVPFSILTMICIVHRLVELAEFYQLGGYQDWCRMNATDLFADDSDSSSSSDGSNHMTREEAVRHFPEAAHQALAATLGLIYYKIRNEVGDGPTGHVPIARPLKRQQDEVTSTSTSSKSKPVKIPRRPSVSDTFLHRLITGPSIASKSSTSGEEMDKLGWNPFSDVSDDAMSKLRSIDPQDIGNVLRALEQGRLKMKPSGSEKAGMSPTDSKTSYRVGKTSVPEPTPLDVPTIPNTVPTQPISSSEAMRVSMKASVAAKAPEQEYPEGGSVADTSSTASSE
ncbi:hypothetical protein N7509_006035 [Penicillium cosmopolitanum]|uniref:Uncharacterized protein n=1 Tax=Penicillium cosmopolitanum TaxID=1131564 RepID=A0A9X0BAM7_9EURO|nr:uncharacterized protein N7509_006035 [Penicillium cosmopolitanum]KAJ5397922.1 hypothetical protein N7509_006035 [Penicillium cosmopolitanum]